MGLLLTVKMTQCSNLAAAPAAAAAASYAEARDSAAVPHVDHGLGCVCAPFAVRQATGWVAHV